MEDNEPAWTRSCFVELSKLRYLMKRMPFKKVLLCNARLGENKEVLSSADLDTASVLSIEKNSQ